MKIPKLSILLPTILVSWLVGCVAVHGGAIFAYLGMHAITTGVFATFMWRAERNMAKKSVARVQTSATPDRTPANADHTAAVA